MLSIQLYCYFTSKSYVENLGSTIKLFLQLLQELNRLKKILGQQESILSLQQSAEIDTDENKLLFDKYTHLYWKSLEKCKPIIMFYTY